MSNLAAYITITVIVISMFTSLTIDSNTKANLKIEMAKAGLEQCKPTNTELGAVWVKSCKEYLETKGN